ncbi:bifunctional hydroxymethylpyrimidine kinase/phosphomethylpyrimidine kinase [Mycobacterium sp. 050134]|uniref:bifunctional hydroxymethylpyrimidine kinase/phosphomethylpyrimidine kinase n=1 Tax=Mycobacterium sp. 050134 TaxID=3096111 RepID=UPI002EDB7023
MTNRDDNGPTILASAASSVPVGLTIGSSDSSGGAGIQGDIKAMAAVGCYAATVVVGVTAQNTNGIMDRFTVPVDTVLTQLDAVLSDIDVDAIKVGMTWSAAHIQAVAERLGELDTPIVVDPVMVTAAGAKLAGACAVDAVRRWLFPIATVITPNISEARMLTGLSDGTPCEMAERLVEFGAAAAVVTCGGVDGGEWYAEDAISHELFRPGYVTGAEHGAGCSHSALLTGLLASGTPTRVAAEQATQLAAEGVRAGLISVGNGVHPVDMLGIGQTYQRRKSKIVNSS